MLTSNLTLDNSGGAATEYHLQTYLTDGSRRINIASSLSQPEVLEIKHSSSGKGATTVDRHLVSAFKTVNNGAGVPLKGGVNLTFNLPRDPAFDPEFIFDLLSVIVDLVTDGGFGDSGMTGNTTATAILRGES